MRKKEKEKRRTHVQRIIKPQPLIQRSDRLDILLLQIEAQHVQVLRQPPGIIALRDDGDVPLRRPPQ